MAVFRVERIKDYTVMSNHHLRNKNLSLKAKGLLSQMLSLPDDWDYTLKGLAAINKESVDAIRTAIWELEDAGYVVRIRVRDERGCLRGCDYYVYEYPQTLSSGSGSGKGAAGFGDLAMTAMFIGLVSAYIGSYLGGFISSNGLFTFSGDWTPLLVAAVSAGVMALFVYLAEKKHITWVENFSIAGSMLAGMAAAVLVGLL